MTATQLPKTLPCILLLCSFAFLLACNKGLDAGEKLSKPTDEEATKFGKSLESTLNKCNIKALSKMLDMEAMARKAIRESEVPKKAQPDVLDGALSSMNNEFLTQLCRNQDGAFARFFADSRAQGPNDCSCPNELCGRA